MKQENKIVIKGKKYQGKIVSLVMQKTAVVEVESIRRHPIYKKAMRKTNRLAAHNELEGLALGDTVVIKEVKPMSKSKHFIVLKKI